MSDKPKLLPCPFCGGEAGLLVGGRGSERWAEISCMNIDCPADPSARARTQKAAAKRWNTRAPLTRPAGDSI